VDGQSSRLRAQLKLAGLSDRVIDAAWPAWWSDEAAQSKSAQTELRFTVARRLGISPKSLSGDGRVEFIWRDSARFKHLTQENDVQQSILASFGTSIGRALIQATPLEREGADLSADGLRDLLLQKVNFVDLRGLLVTCWAHGIPVVHLRVFPLETKFMHAMVVRSGRRYAILLGRDAQYPAPVAFTLAHEMGHAALDHIPPEGALVDFGDPAEDSSDIDDEEKQADAYALELLTGRSQPEFRVNTNTFGAKQLAASVLAAAATYRIEPGTLALCYAYKSENWERAQAALHYIYTESKPVWLEVNRIASKEILWDDLPGDSADYLRCVMGIANAQ
jgi:Zn-dependent peptidase ImmA (M78 family)